MNSIGPMPMSNAAGRPQAERPRLFEELPVLLGQPRREIRRDADERALMSWCRLSPTR